VLEVHKIPPHTPIYDRTGDVAKRRDSDKQRWLTRAAGQKSNQ